MKIVIYSKESCSGCVSAKSFLDEKGLEYEVIDIDKDKEGFKELIAKGATSIPYIIVNDKELEGFDADKLTGLLEA